MCLMTKAAHERRRSSWSRHCRWRLRKGTASCQERPRLCLRIRSSVRRSAHGPKRGADRLLTSCAIKDGIEVLLGFGAAAASLEQCALLDEQRHMMDVAINL